MPEPSSKDRVYSHSRLSSFENCPKAFHYRYVLKIPSEKEGVEAFMGKRVHSVLERLYTHVGRGHLPSLEAVVERYHTDWEAEFRPEEIRIARKGTPASLYRNSGESCLRNFYARHAPFNRSETLGLEEKILFDLDPDGGHKIQGFIDRISRTPDGTIEVEDYKTGKRVPSQRVLDNDRQLALYEIGVREKHGPDVEIRLVWHYVQSDRTQVSRRTPDQLERLREATLALIERIEAEEEFSPRTSPLCQWCDYLERCPAQGRQ